MKLAPPVTSRLEDEDFIMSVGLYLRSLAPRPQNVVQPETNENLIPAEFAEFIQINNAENTVTANIDETAVPRDLNVGETITFGINIDDGNTFQDTYYLRRAETQAVEARIDPIARTVAHLNILQLAEQGPERPVEQTPRQSALRDLAEFSVDALLREILSGERSRGARTALVAEARDGWEAVEGDDADDDLPAIPESAFLLNSQGRVVHHREEDELDSEQDCIVRRVQTIDEHVNHLLLREMLLNQALPEGEQRVTAEYVRASLYEFFVERWELMDRLHDLDGSSDEESDSEDIVGRMPPFMRMH